MIEFEQLSLLRGGKTLLENADLRLHDGDRVALIGANGSGKSSLFALLRGELEPDHGSVRIPANWRIAHMAQEVSASSRAAADLASSAEVLRLRVELPHCKMHRRQRTARAHRLIQARHGW